MLTEKLAPDQHLVIVVDALDEVEQSGSGNLLDLPKNLPERIYFLLTRRPYELKNKRLFIDEGVQQQELDLRANQYADFNKQDIKEYISFFINDHPDYQDNLKDWIRRKHHSNCVEAVAVTPDGLKVISGSWDNTLKVWCLETGNNIATFTGESPLLCCAIAPDGVTIVVGDCLGKVHFLRLEKSNEYRT